MSTISDKELATSIPVDDELETVDTLTARLSSEAATLSTCEVWLHLTAGGRIHVLRSSVDGARHVYSYDGTFTASTMLEALESGSPSMLTLRQRILRDIGAITETDCGGVICREQVDGGWLLTRGTGNGVWPVESGRGAAWIALGMPCAATIYVAPTLASGQPARCIIVRDYEFVSDDLIDVPVVPYPALRQRDSLASLPADSDPLVQTLHLASTAGDRASSRVRAATVAACQYVLDEDWCDRKDVAAWVRLEGPSLEQGGYPTAITDEQRSAISVLAALEVHGVGGPGGYSGDSTQRMSWARGLGKGRRQATDGAAWTAAIGGIAHAVAPSAAQVLAVVQGGYIRYCDLEWPLSYALAQASESKHDRASAAEWCDVARAVMVRASDQIAPVDCPALALGRRYGL